MTPRPPSDPSVALPPASIVPPAPETIARPQKDTPTVAPTAPSSPVAPPAVPPRVEQLP